MTQIPQVDVVGVGLNATDTLIPVEHYPARGSKVEFRSARVLPGGQTATAMVACQKWGLHTRYVGKIGDDGAGALHRAEFENAGRGSALVHDTRMRQPAGLHHGG